MTPEVRRRYEKGLLAPLTWNANGNGQGSWFCFTDREERSFGPDPQGDLFKLISGRMLSGQYYPPDVIEVFWEGDGSGFWKPGNRVLQRVRMPLGLSLWSMVEINVAEKKDDVCRIGYLTTAYHHGRGIWQATLTRVGSELKMVVEGTACPQSWLFWIGLPYARYMQRRAWRKALDRFSYLADSFRRGSSSAGEEG